MKLDLVATTWHRVILHCRRRSMGRVVSTSIYKRSINSPIGASAQFCSREKWWFLSPVPKPERQQGTHICLPGTFFGDNFFFNRSFVPLFSNVLQHIRLRFMQCNDKRNPVKPHKFSWHFYKAVRSIDSIEIKGPFLWYPANIRVVG